MSTDGDRTLASAQLRRMRGMTRLYHEQFFRDIRYTTTVVLGLFVAGWSLSVEVFLLVPVAALLGAVATSFDASYLIFARQYAARLEQYLDATPLVASELESAYLFPLDDRKIVTAALGRGFSYFGFVTLFYPLVGVAAAGFALVLGWPAFDGHGDGWAISYLVVLGSLTAATLAAGVWWFVAGVGERRLRAVLDRRFGSVDGGEAFE